MQKTISVREAAEMMGVTPEFIMQGLRSEKLPIGVAIKKEGSSTYRYGIWPERVKAYIEGRDIIYAAKLETIKSD